MGSVFHLLIFLILTETCFSQTEYINSQTLLPTKAKVKIIQIDVEEYGKDTLIQQFRFLTAKFTKINRLKKVEIHQRIIAESYYLIDPSTKKYTYGKRKNCERIYSEDMKEKYVTHFKDRLNTKKVYISNEGLYWGRSFHERRRSLVWERTKWIDHYSYDIERNLIQISDKEGNVYRMKYDISKNCVEKSYFNNNTISWVQSYKYDADNNLIEMIQKDKEGKIQWREANEYNLQNLMTCNRLYVNGDKLFFQINFIYQDMILQRREDLDIAKETKTLFNYSYK